MSWHIVLLFLGLSFPKTCEGCISLRFPISSLFFFTSLSGNKGLCGVPSLPACPFFWEKGNLSTGGKVAIGLACGVFLIVLLLLIYILCIRRGRHDYDFAPTQDLTCKFSFLGSQSVLSIFPQLTCLYFI